MGVMSDGTEHWCKIWKKTDLCFQKHMKKLANFCSQAEKNDSISDSKMAELNQNENSKQSGRPYVVWKFFTLGINE